MNAARTVILYIAASLDGYIAAPNDNLSFLSMVEQEGEDYGYADFIKTVDTVIMGRKTYDWILKHVPEYVHADKESYIITRSARPSVDNTHFYNGDLTQLLLELKSKDGGNIFIDGGAEVVNELLRHKLIDEYVISIIPVLLGDGVRLFKDGRPEQDLELIRAESFPKGLVQLHYRKR